MNITVIGNGHVGGGLAALWEQARPSVTRLGHGGGDAADADVVVVAVLGAQLSQALQRVSGLAGKTAVDNTNAFGERNDAFGSLAAEVKSFTGAPVAKPFNLNSASLYGEVAAQRARPSTLYVAGGDAGPVAEQLITDAGYDPVRVGGLDRARPLEDLGWVVFAARDGRCSTGSQRPANSDQASRRAGKSLRAAAPAGRTDRR